MSSKFKPSWFTAAWVFWVLFFLVVEGYALMRRSKSDTFSEHWWTLFRVRQKTPTWLKVGLTVLQVGFGVWLTGHLAFGIWST